MDEAKPGACCRALLSEGLDLCVRARRLDAMDRRQANLDASADQKGWVESGLFDRYVERHNMRHPDTPISTRSGTVPLWAQEAYDRDLADWERRVQFHLTMGCDSAWNRRHGAEARGE